MTQQTRHVTIRLITPLLLGDASGVGNYEQTHDYIPGSVLRGAIAARLLDDVPEDCPCRRDYASCSPEQMPTFGQVFANAQPPIFGNAYPSPPRSGLAYPFPTTARTCKQHPGYEHAGNKDGHGVFDTLIFQVAYDLFSDPQFPHRAALLPQLKTEWARIEQIYDPRCGCPGCDESVQPAEGYYHFDGARPGATETPKVARATHVGINRARGVAEDNLLFTLETLEKPGQIFRCTLSYDDTYVNALNDALALDGTPTHYYIGRGRSRGMGNVELTVEPETKLPEMQKRLAFFNYKFREVLKSYYVWNNLGEPQVDGHFFSLTLSAPAIFTDAIGIATLWPDLHIASALPLRAWARTTTLGGWDAAATLPRRTCQGVEAGAVYLYYISGISQNALCDQLVELEKTGIGAQRDRGLGQVVACAPFHYAGWRRK